MHPKTFAKHLQHDGIVAAIRDAEQKTTGEIRVSISHKHIDDAVAAAQAEFLRLGMDKSPERNGVLIFVAPRAHKFAVIGDEAVHAKCGDEFWRQLADAMSRLFSQIRIHAGHPPRRAKGRRTAGGTFPSPEGIKGIAKGKSRCGRIYCTFLLTDGRTGFEPLGNRQLTFTSTPAVFNVVPFPVLSSGQHLNLHAN